MGAVIAGLYARVFLRPRRLPSGYVLTGRRLFTVTREGIDVRPLGALPPPTVVHRAVDGVGTITFGKRKAMPNLTSEGFRPAQLPPRLVQVADVDRVLDIVTAAMRAV
ncbi:hypothetical protein ACFQV2_13585 [Actinokineospora soli]|uniref:PH domain-containing protein n=1 Tax=Actinokineospora soli TaxID=1048753 RepID=A0ABW2TNM2_9PSEU